jgi:uncharacterized OsmC-like protein
MSAPAVSQGLPVLIPILASAGNWFASEIVAAASARGYHDGRWHQMRRPAGLETQEMPMKAEELRALQAPIKARYRDEPAAALVTLKAQGTLGAEGLTCKLDTGRALVEAGLHPATGGDGLAACSGDMLLEALVACAGVTLRAVATALEIPLRGGVVRAEGDLDFRGTLGVSKDVEVGFREIRLNFDLDTDATAEQQETLLKLAKRYCVIYQTLLKPPRMSVVLPAR